MGKPVALAVSLTIAPRIGPRPHMHTTPRPGAVFPPLFGA